MKLIITFLHLLAASVFLPFSQAHARTLLVDFSRNLNSEDPNAAVFRATGGSSLTRDYTFGSQGYTGTSSMDTGSGLTVGFQTILISTGANDGFGLRSDDRDTSKADLVSDWFSVEGTGVNTAGVDDPKEIIYGYRVNITGLQTGIYNFSSMHIDTSNQAGVFDVQYSLDGGTTWIDLLDNAAYGQNTPLVSLSNLSLTEDHGFSIRYATGGALFGDNAVLRNGGNTNRHLPLNSIEISTITGPSSPAPQLTGFTYNPIDGASGVSIKGAANTDYKLTEADDLDFSAPDQDPVPLTAASVGTLNGNQVTTDANGDATVQFNLGTSKASTFIRAESVE